MSDNLLQRRAAGVLMPLFCLPSRHGIGDLGTQAVRFLEFLKEAGQRYWQILPVTPAGAGHSPYQSLSAFAGDPLYINLAELAAAGLVERARLRRTRDLAWGEVSYSAVERFKGAVLREAFDRLEAQGGAESRRGFHEFCAREKEWLEPYCAYMAIKEDQGMRGWMDWPKELGHPLNPAVAQAVERLAPRVRYHRWLQFVFQGQWDRLRKKAGRLGISIIGDLPIFISMDSADAWARQDLFRFDRVAGVPPDYFSRDGQVWGNPVYRWARHQEEHYHWWKKRFRRLLGMFDVVRVDHFIGFHRTWSVPAGSTTAHEGQYEPGPGQEIFRAVEADMGRRLNIIAEDLGALTPEVEALRDSLGYPGMKVLQFAFGGGTASGSEQPHNYRRNLVAYTGTHDNNTTVGWFLDGNGEPRDLAFEAERAFALKYVHGSMANLHWDMIRAVVSSHANTAIIPVQDLFGLGTQARVNRPGTAEGNWKWRLPSRLLTRRAAGELRDLCETYGRP